MKLAVCVLGWYFPEGFYRDLYAVPLDTYVVSHRDEEYLRSEVPFYERIRERVLIAPNCGLDWGGYSQFNDAGEVWNYDAVVYCHDDIVIKDAGFVDALTEKLRDPSVQVVGNGNNGVDTEFAFAKYRDDIDGSEEDGFVVRTVRGSFFAARTSIFERIGNFPVEWKASAGRMKKGNVSLRNFGYRVTKAYGLKGIDYLDAESWLDTRFICEMRRGEPVTATT